MTITIQFGEASLWDALAAVGTLGAVIVAVWLAVADRRALRRDKADRAYSAARLAERMATSTHLLIEAAEKQAGETKQMTSHGARIILKSGAMAELRSGFAELKPSDMPDEGTAQAYVGMRRNARDMIGLLEILAEARGSAARFDAAEFYRINGQQWSTLQDGLSRYKHGLISVKKWQGIKRRREKQVRAAIAKDLAQKDTLTPSTTSPDAPGAL